MANVITDDTLLERIAGGAERLADVLSPGYGPRGRNTIYDQEYDIPLAVNAGKKILKEFCLRDSVANIGVGLLRDAALQVDRLVGDGTTATVILANAAIRQGMRLIEAGVSPVRLRSGMKKAIPVVECAIKNAAVPADNAEILRRTASAAADSEEIGSLAAQAFAAAEGGIINIVDSQESGNRLEVSGGIKYGYGYQSAAFGNTPGGREAVLERPYILLVDRKIRGIEEIARILDGIVRERSQLLIVTKEMDAPLLCLLLANNHKKVFYVVAANGPGHGGTCRRNMHALAAKTGAVLIDEECGLELEACGLEICGRADLAVVSQESTLIKGLWNEDRQRVDELKKQTEILLKAETSPYEIEKRKDTRSILEGRGVTVVAGGMTEYEMFEHLYQIENAVGAVYAASRTGVVAGGGKGYLLAIPALEQEMSLCGGEERMGMLCVKKALSAPLKCLADNAGDNGAYVAEVLMEHRDEPFWGYDAVRHEFRDLKGAGILDPTETLCSSFRVAMEIAGIILTVSGAVTA